MAYFKNPSFPIVSLRCIMYYSNTNGSINNVNYSALCTSIQLQYISYIFITIFFYLKTYRYDTKLYVDHTFQDCILKDDITGAKESLRQSGQYSVTASEVKKCGTKGIHEVSSLVDRRM